MYLFIIVTSSFIGDNDRKHFHIEMFFQILLLVYITLCALALQAIVWDEYLTGPFGLIAQYSLLKVSDLCALHLLLLSSPHTSHRS